MAPRSAMHRTKIAGVSSVHMCLLCRYRVVTDDADSGLVLSERKESMPMGVCRHCKRTYLSIGVALVNPESRSVMVITEQAFKAIFDQPIPEQRIVRVEEAVIEKVYGLFLASQEARANICRARRAMPN
jgi:hypothetical protein